MKIPEYPLFLKNNPEKEKERLDFPERWSIVRVCSEAGPDRGREMFRKIWQFSGAHVVMLIEETENGAIQK